ncbi:cytochrome c biogenesis CcdA family protein [Aestuariivirga sp.]|uniref:cytochrome c biogenesis CcdA family protein n=1 Tax=Aestuariivirga sp. TaxID=2650926 RepID=UPI003593C34F
MSTTLLALLAGILTVLSPCVLPLLPLVLGAAASHGRTGPVYLAAGVTISFVAIGLFVALVGYSIGLDEGVFRVIAAIIMIAVGLLLSVPVFQQQFALAAGPASNWINERWGNAGGSTSAGQFGLGALLGAVWAPCVGPTLGAASVLAAQGENLGEVTLTMTAFGIGAALPLLVLGLLSRELLMKWRGKMLSASGTLKALMGVILVAVGVSILTGADKSIESRLVEWSPDWLTELTTRY